MDVSALLLQKNVFSQLISITVRRHKDRKFTARWCTGIL